MISPTRADSNAPPAPPVPARPVIGRRVVALVATLTATLLAFTLLPPIRSDARLVWTFVGVGSALLVWEALLFASARARGRSFRFVVVIVKAHYVQAIVQGCIYVYWGWHWPQVVGEAPLILAQTVFFYNFTALLAWSRGRPWQIGFGPLPIILSTNLLLWFRHDWYFLQFAMLAAGALGKEFIRWRRDGRWTHIFNPSVFGQSLFGIALITTGTTTLLSQGETLASSFERLPHIFTLLFVLGIVVQYQFSVTLMTLSAVGALCAVNLVYTSLTGSYYFATLNIGATVFLGAHLLLTDPATSPRTNTGRLIFGALYGLGYAFLFRLFDNLGTPLFWDKLLPVPILNLSVPLLDRLARSGIVGRFNGWWENALAPRRLNLVHMAGWTALFSVMLATDFVQGPHEGRSLAFWRRAYDEGLPRAGHNLRLITRVMAEHDNAEACNMLGKLYLEGELMPRDEPVAAHWFARSCNLGYVVGCENVVGQFLFQHRAESSDDLEHAIEVIEDLCGKIPDGTGCFLAGLAHELGVGRPHDKQRARDLYEEGCRRGNADACAGLERLGALRPPAAPANQTKDR